MGMKETLETPTIVATNLDFAYGGTFKRFATASCSLKAVWQHHRQLFWWIRFHFQIDLFKHPKKRERAHSSASLAKTHAGIAFSISAPSLFVIHQPNKWTRCVLAFWVNQANYRIPIVSLMNSAVRAATKKRPLSHDRLGKGWRQLMQGYFYSWLEFPGSGINIYLIDCMFPPSHPSRSYCLCFLWRNNHWLEQLKWKVGEIVEGGHPFKRG